MRNWTPDNTPFSVPVDVLTQIGEHGPITIHDLAIKLGRGYSATSDHVLNLTKVGLVLWTAERNVRHRPARSFALSHEGCDYLRALAERLLTITGDN